MSVNSEKREPFRRRRPKTFYFLCFLAALFVLNIFASIYGALDEKGTFSGPRFGVIRIDGSIKDSEQVVAWAEKLGENSSVRGVLLRIDSGGGAVVPSQEMFQAVKRLAAKKPVVASMGSMGASGAYYAAVGADYIMANPATVTGSIGVKMQLVDLSGLLGTTGVGAPVLVSGRMKDAGSPFRSMTPEEKTYLESMILDMYETFVGDVAASRKLPLEEVRALADGRAYTGRQALALKLVDGLGDMDAALDELTRRCRLEERPKQMLDGPPEERGLLETLLSSALRLKVEALQEGASGGRYLFYY